MATCLLVAASATPGICASTSSGSHQAPRSDPEINVWLPYAGGIGETPSTSPTTVRSSATFQRAGSCAQGEWRWREPIQVRPVRANLASSLIVRLESSDDTKSTPTSSILTTAGEEIAAILRVATPTAENAVKPDPRRATTRTGAPITDPDAIERLHGDWLAAIDALTAHAAATLTRAVETAKASRIRLTVTIAREEAGIDSAPYEICNAGRWEAVGHRAVSIKRIPIAPRFYGPVLIEFAPNGAASESAKAAVQALASWLSAEYAREAAAAAHLATGGDPRVLEIAVGSLASTSAGSGAAAR